MRPIIPGLAKIFLLESLSFSVSCVINILLVPRRLPQAGVEPVLHLLTTQPAEFVRKFSARRTIFLELLLIGVALDPDILVGSRPRWCVEGTKPVRFME